MFFYVRYLRLYRKSVCGGRGPWASSAAVRLFEMGLAVHARRRNENISFSRVVNGYRAMPSGRRFFARGHGKPHLTLPFPSVGIEPAFLPSQGSVLSIERRGVLPCAKGTTTGSKPQIFHEFLRQRFERLDFRKERTQNVPDLVRRDVGDRDDDKRGEQFFRFKDKARILGVCFVYPK